MIEEYVRQALLLGVILSALPLGASLAVGLVSGILQASTQIQDQALGFVPKVVVVSVVLVLCGGWLSDKLVDFARELLLGLSAF